MKQFAVFTKRSALSLFSMAAVALLGACRDCPVTPDDCTQILVNPSFETTNGLTPHPGYSGAGLTGVEGWSEGPGGTYQLNSPDIFNSPGEIPDNFMGTRTPLDGNNYAGISQGKHYGDYLNESLMGTLNASPAGPRRKYTVSAWFASGSARPYPSDIEMVLLNSETGNVVQVMQGRVPNTMQWSELSGNITTTQSFNRLVIRGIRTEQSHTLSYAYVDKVSVRECSGGGNDDNLLF